LLIRSYIDKYYCIQIGEKALEKFDQIIRFADLEMSEEELQTIGVPKLRKGTLKGYKKISKDNPEGKTLYRLKHSVQKISPFPEVLLRFNIDGQIVRRAMDPMMDFVKRIAIRTYCDFALQKGKILIEDPSWLLPTHDANESIIPMNSESYKSQKYPVMHFILEVNNMVQRIGTEHLGMYDIPSGYAQDDKVREMKDSIKKSIKTSLAKMVKPSAGVVHAKRSSSTPSPKKQVVAKKKKTQTQSQEQLVSDKDWKAVQAILPQMNTTTQKKLHTTLTTLVQKKVEEARTEAEEVMEKLLSPQTTPQPTIIPDVLDKSPSKTNKKKSQSVPVVQMQELPNYYSSSSSSSSSSQSAITSNKLTTVLTQADPIPAAVCQYLSNMLAQFERYVSQQNQKNYLQFIELYADDEDAFVGTVVERQMFPFIVSFYAMLEEFGEYHTLKTIRNAEQHQRSEKDKLFIFSSTELFRTTYLKRFVELLWTTDVHPPTNSRRNQVGLGWAIPRDDVMMKENICISATKGVLPDEYFYVRHLAKLLYVWFNLDDAKETNFFVSKTPDELSLTDARISQDLVDEFAKEKHASWFIKLVIQHDLYKRLTKEVRLFIKDGSLPSMNNDSYFETINNVEAFFKQVIVDMFQGTEYQDSISCYLCLYPIFFHEKENEDSPFVQSNNDLVLKGYYGLNESVRKIYWDKVKSIADGSFVINERLDEFRPMFFVMSDYVHPKPLRTDVYEGESANSFWTCRSPHSFKEIREQIMSQLCGICFAICEIAQNWVNFSHNQSLIEYVRLQFPSDYKPHKHTKRVKDKVEEMQKTDLQGNLAKCLSSVQLGGSSLQITKEALLKLFAKSIDDKFSAAATATTSDGKDGSSDYAGCSDGKDGSSDSAGSNDDNDGTYLQQQQVLYLLYYYKNNITIFLL